MRREVRVASLLRAGAHVLVAAVVAGILLPHGHAHATSADSAKTCCLCAAQQQRSAAPSSRQTLWAARPVAVAKIQVQRACPLSDLRRDRPLSRSPPVLS
jgi:hypothetical protein